MGLDTQALPPFPWDSLTQASARARAHPDGVIDLSVGTPVDSTPAVIREALIKAADSPGYPTTHGTPALREAVAAWFARRRRVPYVNPDAVLPTVGSKEFVALLPSLLGLGPGDVVVHPRCAYPTYDVGARLAGAATIATDDVEEWKDDARVKLVWVNSPSNPTGAVVDAPGLAAVVAAARNLGAVVASDECYAELAWDVDHVPSVLDPVVAGNSHDGLLAVYSLSKQSSLAGYRAAFVAGDPRIVTRLLGARKHMGLMVPAPVQAAMVAALTDDAHVASQRDVYQARRAVLRPAVEAAGMRVDHSEAGLYLWATRSEDCWDTVNAWAEHGIVVAPGAFYGDAGVRHVRIALTASDDAIVRASARLNQGQ